MKKNYLFLLLIIGVGKLMAQELHPYLQAVTPNSIYVNWKTSSDSEAGPTVAKIFVLFITVPLIIIFCS